MEGPLFTCITCYVGFRLADDQRAHYKSDWHRYNLKRKVADMKPISQADFDQRVVNQQAKLEEEEQKAQYSGYCEACCKSFGTLNSYTNHLNSKRHLENAARGVTPRKPKATEADDMVISDQSGAPLPAATGAAQDDAVEAGEMTQEEIDRRIAEARKFTSNECIFCSHESADFESNMDHMTVVHSLFVPDAEFVVDLEGLIRYLGESISIGNMCIYCTRGFASIEATQRHMVDKGHCKIYYEDDMDEGIDDFYDFRPSYPDYDPENADAEIDPADNAAVMDESGMQLVLPSGRRVAHRSMDRFYKQKFKPEDPRASTLVNKLVNQYRALGWHAKTPEESRDVRSFLHTQAYHRMRMGIRTNMLFKPRGQMMQF